MKHYYQDDLVTLYHGDCLEVTEWLAADVLVTDPPYGIAWTARSMDFSKRMPVANAVAGDEDTTVRDAALSAWGARPSVVFGTWRAPRPAGTKQRLVWYKANSFPGHSTAAFYSAEEEIYLLGSGFVGSPMHNVIVTKELRGTRHGLAATTGHPTPKPVELVELLISKCPEGCIADPFAGSGSTLIAAALQGRCAIGVEVEERYCETIANRLAQGALDFGAA